MVATDAPQARTQLMVWWIIWFAFLGGPVAVYLLMGHVPARSAATGELLVNLSGLVPLFVSIVVRWLVLPRYEDLKRAFPMFVAGLALGEASGVMGIFMGGPLRDDLFLLGILGIAQYLPFFAKRYFESKPEGFIRNN